jgi:hypothetical protein
MGCYLRVSGRRFDVDAYLRLRTALAPTAVHRRGTPVFPSSQAKGRKHTRSGLNVQVSGRSFENFAGQLRDAERFLRMYLRALRALRRFPGVEGAVLDFGVARREDVVVQGEVFSEAVVALAGRIGLALELSHYPPRDRKSGLR